MKSQLEQSSICAIAVFDGDTRIGTYGPIPSKVYDLWCQCHADCLEARGIDDDDVSYEVMPLLDPHTESLASGERVWAVREQPLNLLTYSTS